MWLLVWVLGAGLLLALCPINHLIITQENTDNQVTNFNSEVERGFPASLVSTSVLYTVV